MIDEIMDDKWDIISFNLSSITWNRNDLLADPPPNHNHKREDGRLWDRYQMR